MRRRNIMDRVTQAMDLSIEPIPGKPLIEIFDNKKILIENHCGVISYDPQQVSIKTKKGVITVSGDCMHLSKMSQDLLCICGRIFCVSLKEQL